MDERGITHLTNIRSRADSDKLHVSDVIVGDPNPNDPAYQSIELDRNIQLRLQGILNEFASSYLDFSTKWYVFGYEGTYRVTCVIPYEHLEHWVTETNFNKIKFFNWLDDF